MYFSHVTNSLMWVHVLGLMSSTLLGDFNDTVLLQSTNDNMSDSGNFDAVLELLAKGSQRSIPECVMMVMKIMHLIKAYN